MRYRLFQQICFRVWTKAKSALLKNLADKAASLSMGAQSIDIGEALKGLLGKIELDVTGAMGKLAPAFDNNPSATRCRMGVDTYTKGTGSFNGADIDIKYAVLGQCKAPYDLSSALLSNNGLLKFNLKNGIDIACKDAENCKCAAITSKLEYSASFDEKKLKSYHETSVLGALLQNIPEELDILSCINVPEFVTKMVSNIFGRLEGTIDAGIGMYSCVNGDLESQVYADFELQNPMEEMPAELRKMLADAGIEMNFSIKAVMQVEDPVTIADVKPGKGVKLFNAKVGTVTAVSDNGIITIGMEDGSVANVPASNLMDMETFQLPEVGDDNSSGSTVAVIAASAGAVCVVAAAFVVVKRRRSAANGSPTESSDIVIGSPELASAPIDSKV